MAVRKKKNAGKKRATRRTLAAFDVQAHLRATPYDLRIFDADAVRRLEVSERNGRAYIRCQVRQRDLLAKPEEIIRQLYILKLMDEYHYPLERLAVEKQVQFGSAVHEKAADIVVFDRDDPEAAYIIVECKKPKRRDGVEQLKSYCNAEGSPIGVWTTRGATVR